MVTSIAMDVGYETLSTFNRNFLRLIGRTPSTFRAERRAGARGKTRAAA